MPISKLFGSSAAMVSKKAFRRAAH